jgi:hypothetical protein
MHIEEAHYGIQNTPDWRCTNHKNSPYGLSAAITLEVVPSRM